MRRIGSLFFNSIRIVVPAVLISTLIGALNGYVIAKWRFRGSEFLFGALLFGCFIPFQVILLPMARLLATLGLANTVTGLVLVHVIYGSPSPHYFSGTFTCLFQPNLLKRLNLMGPVSSRFLGTYFCLYPYRSLL